MPEQKYAVFETGEHLIADNMDLEDALLLCKAIMQEYYADPSLSISIARHEVGGDE